MLKKVMLAAGLAAGVGGAQAAVLLNPGDAALLSTASGSAILSAVAWDGTDLTSVVIAAFGTDAYVVDASSDTVVITMASNFGPVHFDGPSALGPGTYYLATIDGAFDSTALDYKSENFTLVPEPGTCAMIAGLGLVGFAGYRRFRS